MVFDGIRSMLSGFGSRDQTCFVSQSAWRIVLGFVLLLFRACVAIYEEYEPEVSQPILSSGRSSAFVLLQVRLTRAHELRTSEGDAVLK